MAVRIVSLMARLGIDGSGFQQGLAKARHQVRDFGGEIGAHLKGTLAGAFSVYAIERFTHHVIEAVSRFKDLAEQMNIGTDEAQLFDAAAIHSGQSLEDLAAPLNKLATARKNAAEGDQDLRATFARMGITLDDLQNPMLRNIDLLRRIAEHVQKINFTAREAAEFRELFGKSGQKIAAIFRDLEHVHIEPINQDDIKAIHDAEIAIKDLKRELTAVGGIGLAAAIGGNRPLSSRLAGLLTPSAGISQGIAAMLERELNIFFPANANRPRVRSDELVGPPLPDQEPLFEDKSAEKLRLELLEQEAKIREKIFKLQMDTTSVAQKRATLEKEIKFHIQGAADAKEFGMDKLANEEIKKALDLQGELNALELKRQSDHRVNLTDLETRGLLGGFTLDRALALRGPGQDKQAKVEENTRNTVRILGQINNKIRPGTTDETLTF